MSDETDYEVAQRGHNADSRRGADLGGILTERDITHPVNLVFDRPLSADVAGQVFGGGLAGRQAGHAEDSDRGSDLHLLVAAAAFGAFADGAGGVALDEEHLRGSGEPEVLGGVEDADGALVPPAVSGVEALLPSAPARARRPLVVVAAVLVAMVAFTRLALGVHFLSDVVGGFVLGVAWIVVTTTAFRTWRRDEGRAAVPSDDGLEPESAAALVPVPDREPTPLRRRDVAARLVVAAVLLLGVVVGAGLLITKIFAGTGVEAADAAADRWLAGHRTPALDPVSAVAAELGNTQVVIGVGLVAAILAVAVLRRWRPAIFLSVLLLGELAIFLTTTVVIERPRPPVTHLDAALPPTSSFPSGHTAASICLYGGIAALVFLNTRARWRWLVVALAVLVVTAVAMARLYRGAHFPTDVLGSVLFAVPWLLVAIALLRPRDRTPPGCTTDRPASRTYPQWAMSGISTGAGVEAERHGHDPCPSLGTRSLQVTSSGRLLEPHRLARWLMSSSAATPTAWSWWCTAAPAPWCPRSWRPRWVG